ncbi:MAG TPA: hypothetical protein VE685_00580 [Thermoanaerobaculia bacterium]|nr:hypothetical protein [Thermoanaerobaculia bacterium]
MRKMVFTLLMLLAIAGAIGTSAPVEAAKGSICSNPGPGCTCRCECGQLERCCTSGGITTCEPVWDPNILCPQIACL